MDLLIKDCRLRNEDKLLDILINNKKIVTTSFFYKCDFNEEEFISYYIDNEYVFAGSMAFN